MQKRLGLRFWSPPLVGGVALALHHNIADGTYADAPVIIGVFFAVMAAAALCFVAVAALKAGGTKQSARSLLIRDSISALAIFGIALIEWSGTVPVILCCVAVWGVAAYMQAPEKPSFHPSGQSAVATSNTSRGRQN